MGMMKGMGQMGGGAQGGLMPGDGPPRSMRNGPKTAEQKRMEGIQNRMAEGRQYRGSSNTADAQADLLDPDLVRLHFEIDGVGSEHSGPVKILLHRSWSPIGVEHLAGLVRQRVYDGTKFFRVVPGFIVQFGIPSVPMVTRRFKTPIKDDPRKKGVSNRRGTVVFATSGPNSRTTRKWETASSGNHRTSRKNL